MKDKDIYIHGDIWTNLTIHDLQIDGVTVHISGDVFFVKTKKDVPLGGSWMPKAANHRYSIINKRIMKETSLPEKVQNIHCLLQ